MLFKRKEKVNPEQEKEIILTEYVNELKRLGFSNQQIKDKFIEKKYPSEFIDYLLKLNAKEVKPMSEEEYDEDFEEEQEQEDEEEETEPVPVKTKVKKEVKEVKESKPKSELTLENVANAIQVLAKEVETRLQSIEASLYRIRNA
jgi:hypothetical protein